MPVLSRSTIERLNLTDELTGVRKAWTQLPPHSRGEFKSKEVFLLEYMGTLVSEQMAGE